jgi:tol-pal system protein YbgF
MLTLFAQAAAAQLSQPGGGVDVGQGVGAGPPAVARLDSRITQLEQDLRAVTGRVESLSHQVRQLNDKLERLSTDLEMRFEQLRAQAGGSPSLGAAGTAGGSGGGPRMLGRGEDDGSRGASQPTSPSQTLPSQAAAAPPVPAPPPPSPPETRPQTAAPQGSSKEQYAAAFALMQKANYAGASTAFSDFLSRYPDDALADNARYWLGESYYARGDYPRAAETFFEAYERSKTGPKAPDTLLKLGMALGNLNKKKEACSSFRELSRAFPNAAAAIKDKAAQESRRLGCG